MDGEVGNEGSGAAVQREEGGIVSAGEEGDGAAEGKGESDGVAEGKKKATASPKGKGKGKDVAVPQRAKGKAKAPPVEPAASKVVDGDDGDVAAAAPTISEGAVAATAVTNEAVRAGADEPRGDGGVSYATAPSTPTGVHHSPGDVATASANTPRARNGTSCKSHVVLYNMWL